MLSRWIWRIVTSKVHTVAYINKQGGTRSHPLQANAGNIFSWAEQKLASISAIHLAGFLKFACGLSHDEWSLSQELFAVIQKWGILEIDLFCIPRGTAKLKRFFSLDPKDQALGIDALANPWMFSPFM